MIRIPISELAIQVARNKQKQMDVLYAEKKGNYVGLYNEDRWYHGTLGELAFRDALLDLAIKHEYGAAESVGADDGDFTVFWNGQSLNIDVKTSNGAYTKMLLVPDAQLDKHSRNLYVGVRLIKDEAGRHIAAEVIGYLWEYELEPIEHEALQVKNHGALYDDIHPIEDMLYQLDVDEELI